jgi:hypothetical protein
MCLCMHVCVYIVNMVKAKNVCVYVCIYIYMCVSVCV